MQHVDFATIEDMIAAQSAWISTLKAIQLTAFRNRFGKPAVQDLAGLIALTDKAFETGKAVGYEDEEIERILTNIDRFASGELLAAAA